MQFIRTLCVLVAISFLAVPSARAAYTVNIVQSGPNVVATGSGSINFTGMTGPAQSGGPAGVSGNFGIVAVGGFTGFDGYLGLAGAPTFGPGGFMEADSKTGTYVACDRLDGQVRVPTGYAGGDLGTSTATWNFDTFASLGINPGTYVYTMPNDTFTVNIGVPEPTSLGLLAVAAPLLLRRGQRKNWRKN